MSDVCAKFTATSGSVLPILHEKMMLHALARKGEKPAKELYTIILKGLVVRSQGSKRRIETVQESLRLGTLVPLRRHDCGCMRKRQRLIPSLWKTRCPSQHADANTWAGSTSQGIDLSAHFLSTSTNSNSHALADVWRFSPTVCVPQSNDFFVRPQQY